MSTLVHKNYIQDTYVYEDYQWMYILEATMLSILYTTKKLKVCTLVQLIFVCDMILLNKQKLDSELICQINQTEVNEYNNREK